MNTLVLDGAVIWVGDGSVCRGHVIVRDGRIESIADGAYRGPLPKTDLSGMALSPGLIDLMVLGGFDLSILRDNPIEIARRYLRLGVTSLLFCNGTLPWEFLKPVAENVRRAVAYRDLDAARVWGHYAEGPFVVPEYVGGGIRDQVRPPTRENVQSMLDMFGDALHLLNISPGAENDLDAIRQAVSAGKAVSMAHSAAPAEHVLQCLDAGTTVLGHCWDNNFGLIGDSGVQQPTIEHVAFTDERVKWIHIISDGVHVHPILVDLVRRARGLESICLVTDANQKSGTPDGEFIRDNGDVFYKKGGVCRKKRDHGLAGSATFLPDDFRNFVRFTRTRPWEAIRTVTLNPARSIGVDDQVGLVAPGRIADLVAWDDKLRVQRIWRAGREIAPNHDIAETRFNESVALTA